PALGPHARTIVTRGSYGPRVSEFPSPASVGTNKKPDIAARTLRPLAERIHADIASATRTCSHVEPELDHIAVVHDVLLALHADLACRAGIGHGAGSHEVVVGHDLGLDEATLEVRVDDARRLRRRRALRDRPRARFLRARRRSEEHTSELHSREKL